MAGRIVVLGHGYSAGFLTPLLRARGWHVTGTSRDRIDAVAATGASPLRWPGDETEIADRILRADAILISAAPGPDGDPALAAFDGPLRHARPRWLGYLSTTGVYGDQGGDWVDETAPLDPATTRGQARVQAEAAWRELSAQAGLPLHVFRLAGIYGPGRGPFAKLRAGTARRIVKPGQVFSRIHVEDIAQVLLASISRPDPGAVYNVCDDDPAAPQDVIAHAARLLGLPVPEPIAFDQADLAPMARSFYAESKRVSNARIKRDLGVTLRYPDYRTGLAAILRDEETAEA
ncbi:SDR family oxidoreductase [Paracoccus sp. M683]|uniref:SDR family oxidoreductase n=2 Tax=Paracoccus TaxID=265 RepID=UPI001180D967|nr:SDR family oxidoreductase [Paracoccus sp. M683]TRW99567.1 SDR family oxidoreductase [Paracoccus sp. M683]